MKKLNVINVHASGDYPKFYSFNNFMSSGYNTIKQQDVDGIQRTLLFNILKTKTGHKFTMHVLLNTDVVETHLENPKMELAIQITRLIALNRI
jgi:hypothetical protein